MVSTQQVRKEHTQGQQSDLWHPSDLAQCHADDYKEYEDKTELEDDYQYDNADQGFFSYPGAGKFPTLQQFFVVHRLEIFRSLRKPLTYPLPLGGRSQRKREVA